MEIIGDLNKAISEGRWEPQSYWGGLRRETGGEQIATVCFLKLDCGGEYRDGQVRGRYGVQELFLFFK